jgi:hypothetical protein
VDRALAVHLGHFPKNGRSSTPSAPPRTYAQVDTALRAGAPDANRPGLGSRATAPAPQQAKRSEPLAGVRAAEAAPQTQLPRFEPRPVQVRVQPVQTAQAAPVEQKPAPVVQTAPPAQQPVQIAAATPVPAPAEAAGTPAPQVDTQTQLVNAPGFSISPSSAETSSTAAAEESRRVSRLAEVAATLASLPDAPPVEVEAAPKPVAKKPAATPAAAKKDAPAKKETALAKKDVPAKGATAAKKDTAAAKKDTAAAKKDTAAAKKDVPAKKPAAPAEPRRIWVQLAGGANKAALPMEFSRIKAKAPKLLATRTAWTTPLKATNRLLVGPFKTDKEAQDFVNELRKADLGGFAFTSEAGQKIEKLAAK